MSMTIIMVLDQALHTHFSNIYHARSGMDRISEINHL